MPAKKATKPIKGSDKIAQAQGTQPVDVAASLQQINAITQNFANLTEQYKAGSAAAAQQFAIQVSGIQTGMSQALVNNSLGSANVQFDAAQNEIADMGTIAAQADNDISQILTALQTQSQQLNEAMEQWQSNVQQINNTMQQQNVQDANNQGDQILQQASKKIYNYKTAQLMQNNPAPVAPMEPDVGSGQMGKFNTSQELLQKLDELIEGIGYRETVNTLVEDVPDEETKEKVKKSMQIIYESNESKNPQYRLEAAAKMWDVLPDNFKVTPENTHQLSGELERVANNQGNTMIKTEEIKKLVEASNEEIKKMAESNKKPQGYNFKKEAQHKTYENVVLWGPESRRIDPFTGEPISDWHVFERNRGWGFRIGDRWDIDFEAFWRGNIMDKYHRSYRDEDGNWVGGYIEKRFEVDRWQPEENKYMLKPGEKRKPRPAELGNYEARMEAYRGNKDGVYNWAKASGNQKMTKTSNFGLEQIGPDKWKYKGYVIRKDKFVGDFLFQSEDFDGTPEFSEDDQPWDKRYGSSPTLEGAIREIDDMVQNDPNNFGDRMASSKKKR